MGESTFRDDAGHFWGLLETRPYMRARHGLAMSPWEAGRRDEAVTHYWDMLRLNPNDNQGIRYILLSCLLALGREDEADRLIGSYPDDGAAEWMWSQALLSFRRGGDGAGSRAALAQAVATNLFVPAYLLGRKKMPRQLPDLISWGSEDEAIAYVGGAAEAWAAAPGALSWLEAVHQAPAQGTPIDGKEPDKFSIDFDRVDDAVLALLRLGLHGYGRVWKTFDWDAMDRLHEKSFICNPAGKAKSVELTEEGMVRSRQLLHDLFGRR